MDISIPQVLTMKAVPPQSSAIGCQMLRQTVKANSFTRHGCSFQVKSPAVNALLDARQFGVWIQADWTAHQPTGQQNAQNLVRADYNGIQAGNFALWKRANGALLSVSTMTLNVNGSSFSYNGNQLTQFMDFAFSSGFGRQSKCDMGSWCSNPPYDRSDGERNRAFGCDWPDTWVTDDVCRSWHWLSIPIGPMLTSAFPYLKSISGAEVGAIPHISSLELDIQWRKGFPVYWLQHRPRAQDSVAVSRGGLTANRAVNFEDLTFGANNAALLEWSSAAQVDTRLGVEGKDHVAYVAGLQGAPASGHLIKVYQPEMSLVWATPPESLASSLLAPEFKLAHHRFVTYSQPVVFPANNVVARDINFTSIQLDVVPSLVISVVLGDIESFADANYSCPIQFDSLSVVTSTSSLPISNIDMSQVSQYDQYRIFKECLGQDIDFKSWQKYRQCVCFSAREMSAHGMIKGVYSPLSLSVSYKVDRPAQDTATIDKGASSYRTVAAKGAAMPVRNCTAWLVILSDSQIVLKENQCSLSDVRLPAEGVLNAIRGSRGKPQKAEATRLEDMA